MLIQERLQIILKMHQMTPSVFADKIGVQRSNVSHVLSGRSKPSLDFLEKILLNFPRVNAHWLVTGEIQSSTEYLSDENSETKSDLHLEIKQIERIITFYKDGTFDSYLPNFKQQD